MFLLITNLKIVWTCDCYIFADFLMVLLVKKHQIKLLNKVWYILLVLCASFKSFSIQPLAIGALGLVTLAKNA